MKYLILDNIRSAHNVGSMFRTADAAGVDKVFLCGYTPRPVDRFGRPVGEIAKTSLGAVEAVGWEALDDVADIIQRLQSEGMTVVALEQTPGATPLNEFTPPENVAYIVGNEIDGVQEKALGLADQIVSIPMLGQKESLNVAVAAGIILFR